MKKGLLLFSLLFTLLSCYAKSDVYNILDFGANADGKTLTTAAIQKAIDACAANGGGMVYGNEIIFMALGIGDSYQGGIVAYILQSGDLGYDAGVTHGLIAAPSDQSYSTTWGCDGSAISGADGTALGTGNQNTIDIMAGCATAGIAARLCGDLVLNGYSDWYLPSQDELNKLRQSKTAIGNFSGNYYWSSSEYVNSVAYYQVFIEGFTNQNYDYKSTTHAVRAVRSF